MTRIGSFNKMIYFILNFNWHVVGSQFLKMIDQRSGEYTDQVTSRTSSEFRKIKKNTGNTWSCIILLKCSIFPVLEYRIELLAVTKQICNNYYSIVNNRWTRSVHNGNANQVMTQYDDIKCPVATCVLPDLPYMKLVFIMLQEDIRGWL